MGLRAADNAPWMHALQHTEHLARPVTPSAGAGGVAQLDLGRVPLAGEALAALFPDFVIGRDRHEEPPAAVAVWAKAGELPGRHAWAAAQRRPLVVLGEGLLRGAPRGRSRPPCLSVVALDIAGPVSPADRLAPARVLAERGWETPQLTARAATVRQALIRARVGGAWWQAGGESELPRLDGYALVVVSEPVAAGGYAPDEPVLAAMIDAALAENPAERVVLLADGIGRTGLLRARLAAAAGRGATVVSLALDPWIAVERAGQVYSAGGEIGFLALITGRPVAAFGGSFYTGWGLTRDAAEVPERAFPRDVDEVFAAGCLIATRYLDPFRNSAAAFEDIVDLLAEWRRAEIANRRIAVCVGMSFWKRRRVADFLNSAAGTPRFRRTADGAVALALRRSSAEPAAIAAWASRMPEGLAEAAARRGVPLIRVEDGFVRSVGLGSDFLPAASLVFDSRGMYYDPRSQSDLEVLLSEAEFAPPLVERARRLIAQLVARGVTKYNLAGRAPSFEMPAGRRRILVPGQVEDDLSVLYGGGAVRANLDLLARVRADNPDAFIVYKPHPDVAAGHRKGAVSATLARRYADAVVENVSTAALLARIDELHTMTSLAGFEALLRNRRVVVHGRPFYAGWGLTTDLAAIDRGRRLGLEELVAGALILYPRYLDPMTRLPCGPEVVIERLDRPELWRPGLLVLARRMQGEAVRRVGDLRLALSAVGAARQGPRH